MVLIIIFNINLNFYRIYISKYNKKQNINNIGKVASRPANISGKINNKTLLKTSGSQLYNNILHISF